MNEYTEEITITETVEDTVFDSQSSTILDEENQESNTSGVENSDSLQDSESNLSSDEILTDISIMVDNEELIQKFDEVIEIMLRMEESNLSQHQYYQDTILFGVGLIWVIVGFMMARLLYKFINNILLGGI